MTRPLAESSGVQIPAMGKKLSLFQEAQTEIQTHSRGTGVLHLMAKFPGGEADPLVSSGVEIKNEWRYTSAPLIRLRSAHKNKLKVTFKDLTGLFAYLLKC